ncbi:MAG: TRAP transporter small permease subunit [Alphaproteobacteria bacterium]
MRLAFRWLTRGAEGLAAAMLAAMFLVFLLQVFSRYVMVEPFGWTLELCLVLWVWIVFVGCAFVVRDRDHVRFDILYLAAPRGPRRAMALAGAVAVAVGMGWSLLPTWDWIDFLKIKRSPTLPVSMRIIYAVYALFVVAIVLRAAWAAVQVLRRGPPDEAHAIHVGEEG